jgi:hypothetical protein
MCGKCGGIGRACPCLRPARTAVSAAASARCFRLLCCLGGRRLRPAHRRTARRRLSAAAHRRCRSSSGSRISSGPLTPAQRGQALEVAANAEFWLQESGEALKLAAQLEQLGRDQHDDVLVAKGLLDRATILSKKIHDTPMARRLIHQAAGIAAKHRPTRMSDTQALVALAQLSAEDGEPEAGLPLAERAVALRARGRRPRRPADGAAGPGRPAGQR